jgi:hypothetical protein
MTRIGTAIGIVDVMGLAHARNNLRQHLEDAFRGWLGVQIRRDKERERASTTGKQAH